MSNYNISNRRCGSDRRGQSITPKFPFYDSNGALVAEDRRSLPDRRLEGITVEWISEQELMTEPHNLIV